MNQLILFLYPFDARYEDLRKGSLPLNLLRDFTAGLIVAMVAIPLAMGFAMASGLRPEQGIVGGAIAGIAGALFGGSKYQVYGPTAAFIPVIAGLMALYDHHFLVLASCLAGVVLMILGVARLGRIAALVPHSIVVGFTIGIAVTIALSQMGEVLGLKAPLGYRLLDKVRGLTAHAHEANGWAVLLALGTLAFTKGLLRVSIYIPAPLIALGIGATLVATVLKDEGISIVRSKFGEIPEKSWIFTPPQVPEMSAGVLGDLAYFVAAIVVVCAIESLLCSRMADRLAGNTGTPFHPDKELWGQGVVNIAVPLLNGFPHTGALARTATNIKLGAISPLAGIWKGVLKLILAFYLAHYLELIPMPCIGGILLFVAMNMVKPEEVTETLRMGKGHTLLMVYTAVAVIATDFLTGVLTAIAIYALAQPRDGTQDKLPGLRRIPMPARRVAYSHAAAHGHAAAHAAEGGSGNGNGNGNGHAGSHAPGHQNGHGDGHGQAGSHTNGHGPRPRSLRPDVADKRIRAVLGHEDAEARRPDAFTPHHDERRRWLTHIREAPRVPSSAFVHEQATLIGRVVLGESVHIAAGASVRADEGSPFFVGASSNVQDGVVLHALKHRFVRVAGEEWAIYVGKGVSLAHGALVHGPCYVGDASFVGFKAVVHDSIVGARCFIGIGAIVVGVEVAEGRLVPHGALIDTQEKADRLPPATDAHKEFNEDVVEVNRGLAAAYHAHEGAAGGRLMAFGAPAPAAVERIERPYASGGRCSCGVEAGARRAGPEYDSGGRRFGRSREEAGWESPALEMSDRA